VLGVDTIVLVRFLAEDDVEQTPLAVSLLTASANHRIYLAQIVLVEAFWVLTKVMKFPKPRVFDAMRRVLLSEHFKVEEPEEMAQAISDAETAKCDLADALIAIRHLRAGCRTTATFDVDAQRLSGMSAVEDHI
jgi:predicted nucleic-acid-binding protein